MARQIHVDVRIAVADYPTVLSALRQGRYQLAYTTWLADFDDASNFLDLLQSGNPSNYAGYRSAKFDIAMAMGKSTAGRAGRLQKAERIALADMPWLPIRFLSQSEAVGPRVGGYVANPRDYNRSRWLWIK
jgi:oligopeptide transport system substrate-binding protein